MKKIMFLRGLLAIILLLGLGALAGCGESEQSQSVRTFSMQEPAAAQLAPGCGHYSFIDFLPNFTAEGSVVTM